MEETKKVVSICGSADLEGNGVWIEYRFGKPGNIEMRFPADPSAAREEFIVRRYTRAGTTYFKLEFEKGGYNYAILEGAEVGGDPEYAATLRVRQISDGTDVAEFELSRVSDPFNLMKFEDRVRTEPFDE